MKRISFFVISALMMPLMALADSRANYEVVPLPQQITTLSDDPFVLSNGMKVSYPAGDADMKRNAEFLAEYLKEICGIELIVVENEKHAEIKLLLNAKMEGEEAYDIVVNKKGIVVKSATRNGVFYAIQTLRKSMPVGKSVMVTMPAVHIADSPRFVHRGMMLDCSRHFFPLDFVKRFIDILSLHNMNVFHWHLSDDQGWRIEIKKYPRLTEVGSMRSGTILGTTLDDGIPYGGYYTQEQAREIVEYARQRCITVIPEIDMPGHMLAALAAYPELGCTGGPYEVGHHWGIYDDVLCLGNEKVYEFCNDVLDEIMEIFPSKLIHIGGDEAPTTRWQSCAKCQKVAEEHSLTPKTIQGYFTSRIEQHMIDKGRNIIGWDEILAGNVNKSATIQSWRNTEYGSKAAAQGHDVIMSPTSHCYFDYLQVNPDDKKLKRPWRNEPTRAWGFINVEKVYSFEPYAANITEEAKPHILGVQANLWAEYIQLPVQAEYQMMPRMAALAEVQWVKGEKDYQAFLTRLDRLVEKYNLYGYAYARHLWTNK